MRKVFLEKLPRGGKGINQNSINWKESIGCIIHFIYDDIEGDLLILDYITKKQKLKLKYKDSVSCIYVRDLNKVNLGVVIGIKQKGFSVKIGTTFKEEKRNIIIIDNEYRKDKKGYNKKYYKYHCNVCDNEDWFRDDQLLKQKQGCNVCSGRKALLGYNTIWDTNRWMCSLGISEEDAKKYTPQSNEDIYVICPHCKTKKKIQICKIYNNKSISCSCGDGISYPNKFMYNFCCQLLEQGQIKSFETEYKIEDKKYDIYIVLNNEQTLIIENHGEQHGKFIRNGDLLFIKNGNGFKQSNRNDIKEDIYKCRLAYESGIDNYIQLDCSKSDMEYIKNSILNSKLIEYMDFRSVNWDECEKYALKNIVYEVSEYWHKHREVNKEDITTKDLSKVFCFCKSTIIKYLKKGTKFGWCYYDAKKERRLGAIHSNRKQS